MKNKVNQDYLKIKRLIKDEKDRNLVKFENSFFESKIQSLTEDKPAGKAQSFSLKILYSSLVIIVFLGIAIYLIPYRGEPSLSGNSFQLVLEGISNSRKESQLDNQNHHEPITDIEMSFQKVLYSVQRGNLEIEALTRNVTLLLNSINKKRGQDLVASQKVKGIFLDKIKSDLDLMHRKGEFSPLFIEIFEKIKEVSI